MSFDIYSINADIDLIAFEYVLEQSKNNMQYLTVMKDTVINSVEQGYLTGDYSLAIKLVNAAIEHNHHNASILNTHIEKSFREFTRIGMKPENFESFEKELGKTFERPNPAPLKRVSGMTLNTIM